MSRTNSFHSLSALRTQADMLKAVVTCILLAGYAAQGSVHADSFGAFRNFRQVDPTGRYYVVVKTDEHANVPAGNWGTPVTFDVAERKSGSGAVTPAVDSYVPGSGLRVTKPNPDVKVREGDILLGRGKLDRCLGPILISSTGLGFISLNFVHHQSGKPESGDALAVVSRDGAVRYRKKLTDLFSEKEIQQFFFTVSTVFWYRGGWIDEIRKEVIVAGGRKQSSDKTILTPLRTVNLETGEVQETSTSAISRALSDVNRNGLNLAHRVGRGTEARAGETGSCEDSLG